MFFWALSFCLAAADPDAAAVDKLAAAALRSWEAPGVAIAVVRGDDTLVLKGYGKRALGRPEPITPDTVFPLASCSKAFTTTLMAMLVDDETMAWDDPVRKHLPGFKLPEPNAEALLTVRDLLCHRSGIGGHDLLWYRAPWNIDETIRRAQLLPLDYPFRAGYRYSSIPFLVAGRAIEKRTGKKWEELVRTRICEPLGMSGVTFSTTDIPKEADRAAGHRLGKGGQLESMPGYEIREPNPSGSVNATAADLAAWLKFHLAKGVGPDGKRRVSVKNLTETHTPQNIIPMQGSAKALNPETVQLTYAMGWLVYDYRGKKVVSHGGMIDGFRVQITYLPEENLGFAVLCNLHDTRLTLALTNSLIDLYCGLEKKDWDAFYHKLESDEAAERMKSLEARDKARNPNAKSTLALAGYVGKYTHAAYGTATVTEKDGKLTVVYGNFTCPLEHFERDTFRVTDGFLEEQLVPFIVADGKVASVKFGGMEFKRD
jgi:CubicO group peptidase (beta-lactamase class C family)